MSVTAKDHRSNPTHGSMSSYVIGFILSLIFTFIPYYMVVNQIVTGTALLVTILGIAIIQMLIQIVFFLHLGRGPKPFYNISFFLLTVGTILIVVAGSIVIIKNLHHNKTPSDQTKVLVDGENIYQIGGEKTGACQGQHANHRVIIKDGKVSPVHTLTKKCDTLTFTNEDDQERKISFGEHEMHITYAGESEIVLRKNRSKTITLSELGAYEFHDHLKHETAGYFTVIPE